MAEPTRRLVFTRFFTCPCRRDAPLDGLFGAKIDGETPPLYPAVGAITLCIYCGDPYELTETGWRSVAVDALDPATASALRGVQSTIARGKAHRRDG
jgi:hypothetical protein